MPQRLSLAKASIGCLPSAHGTPDAFGDLHVRGERCLFGIGANLETARVKV